ncbi:MAG: HigA family addiction module antidote protein [Deltaproteobacteria bacterium]|jgi:addiction module HigA family antidote|nr:HigA family addiction module antidote protein [Deltaproteobacteria bacterium]
MLERSQRSRRPSHPGAIIRAHYLEPLDMTVTALAQHLGVSRKTLSKVVNERGSITPDMAQRLGRAFDTGPELWLNLQQNRDLWDCEHTPGEWQKISPLPGLSDAAEEQPSA